MPMTASMLERFRVARRDPELAVLEGFHALKHALRFGAELLEVVTANADRVRQLARDLAPDLLDRFQNLQAMDPDIFEGLSHAPVHEPVVALARRRHWSAAEALEAGGAAPVVFLENPR